MSLAFPALVLFMLIIRSLAIWDFGLEKENSRYRWHALGYTLALFVYIDLIIILS